MTTDCATITLLGNGGFALPSWHKRILFVCVENSIGTFPTPAT